ncbi:HAMP domain-containing protein [Piscinibacter sp. Jin2]|uniref:HAMP domain-containing protein n=1 Tax=Aquariibacter lacus TaxID=2801332 RepID=A0A9X1BPX5_9BURK|nr:methyl-accepting chemotaxis protein [Piscinibacter lacus]MBL0718966.1 HAMP domain-containing protein [Piscinibacter lacus]
MQFLQHLKIGQKFLLLGILALVMAGIPTVAGLRQALSLRDAAQAEADGLAPARTALAVIRLAQQHRGLTQAALSGEPEFERRRSALQGRLMEALAQWQGSLAVYPPLAETLQAQRRDWQVLTADIAAKRIVAAESFRRHTALVAGALHLLEGVVDDSTMALDPEAVSYYLILGGLGHLPQVTESLGQLRAQGTAALVRGQLEPEQRSRMMVAEGLLRSRAQDASIALDKAAKADPAIGETLKPVREQASARFTAILAMLERTLMQGGTPALDPDAFFQRSTEAIDSQFKLIDDSLAALDGLLHERVDRADRSVLLVLGLAGAMLLLGSLLVWAVTRQTASAVQRTLDAAAAMARGDLSRRISLSSRDELGQIARALDAVMDHVGAVIAEVRQGVDAVQTASTQIAAGNQDLSARTEQQASNLQETAASMEQMNGSVRSHADHARHARELASTASGVAREGGAVVQQVVQTMDDIRGSSSRIGEITGVIDGLAFQTNILALNAAVEAARAGEQGRGFAVVAGEVRTLAQRSAQAAREIRGLIADATGKVASGSELVGQAGATMASVVAQVQQVADLMHEMSAANEEQSRGIEQVNSAVAMLDQSTQQNAALVEESAAAAESLRQQAVRLSEAAARFVLAPGVGLASR